MSKLFLVFTTRTFKSMLSPHVGTATGRVIAMWVSRLPGTTLPLYEVPLYVICWPYCGRVVRWSLLGMESVPYLLSLSAGLVDLTSTRKGWRNRDEMKTNVGQYFGHLQDSWVVHLFVVFRSVLHSVSYEAGNTTEASREVPLSASVFNQKKLCATCERRSLVCVMQFDVTLSHSSTSRNAMHLSHGRCCRSEPIYHRMKGVAGFCNQWPQGTAWPQDQNVLRRVLEAKMCRNNVWFDITRCPQVVVVIHEAVIP